MTMTRCEPLGQVRTKIVATLGPASRDPAVVRAMIEAGVDVFRMNFSHGDHAEHSRALEDVRAAAHALGREVAVLQDLCGPKIRLGDIAGGSVDCRAEDEFTLTDQPTAGDDPRVLTSTYPTLAADLQVGDDVYFADGAVAMTVVSAAGGAARLRVTLPGRFRSHQGINLPGAALSVPSLTPKDLVDLDWTATHDIDYVGLSFVRQASDVTRLRGELDARGRRAVKIVAKVEKPQAVANLDSVIAEADAVMVARGDLGVELDVAKVPAVQKQVIAACRRARVPVITATQMLNSMETSPRPTRAEATDVFNAVLDGTDAVMLSGETAVGAYPVETVETMSRIVREAERLACSLSPHAAESPELGSSLLTPAPGRAGYVSPVTEAVVEAVRSVAARLGATLVVVATHSGRTALVLSKQRYAPPTLALATDPFVARALALCWGVTAVHAPSLPEGEGVLRYAIDWARERGLVAPGDCVVAVVGQSPLQPLHNAIAVEVVAP
jgi:pyruvate kinase